MKPAEKGREMCDVNMRRVRGHGDVRRACVVSTNLTLARQLEE
jgi:hypothetical protein